MTKKSYYSGRVKTPQVNPFVCKRHPILQHFTHLYYSIVFYYSINPFFRQAVRINLQVFQILGYMIVTLIRTLIIVITLIVIMRLMGKRQIGEMQPFEFIVTLIIADLACIPMADINIPLFYGIVAILGLFILHQLLSILEKGGNFFKFVISGKPSLVIDKNGVILDELKKNNLEVSDLIDSMRSLGYFALDDLDYAIFESNGKLSALEKQNKAQTPNSLPKLLVCDGKVQTENLKDTGIDKQDLLAFIKEQNATVKKTEVLTVDGNGRVYFKARNYKYKILKMDLQGENKW